jgi:hypothetical protein
LKVERVLSVRSMAGEARKIRGAERWDGCKLLKRFGWPPKNIFRDFVNG